MMAGIIGSILKKRADHAAVKAEHEKAHPPLPHHTCYRDLRPFPQYPVKSLKTYTVSAGRGRPRNMIKLGCGAAVGDSVNTISGSSGNNNWSQEILDIEPGNKDDMFDNLEDIDESGIGEMKRQSSVDISAGISYATLYMGLIFMSLGLTLFLAGLLDRKPGWHTIGMIVVGPIVFCVGFLSALFPVAQYLFPQFFPFIPHSKLKHKKKEKGKELTRRVPESSTTIDMSDIDVPPTYGSMIQCPIHNQNIYDRSRTPRVTLHSSKESNLRDVQHNSSYSDFDSEKIYVKQSHVSCQYEVQLEEGEVEEKKKTKERREWEKNEVLITPKTYIHNHFS